MSHYHLLLGFTVGQCPKVFPPKCFIFSLFNVLATYPAHRNLLHFTLLTTPHVLCWSHRKTGFCSYQNSQFDELMSNSIISLKSIRISTDNIHTSHCKDFTWHLSVCLSVCLYTSLDSLLANTSGCTITAYATGLTHLNCNQASDNMPSVLTLRLLMSYIYIYMTLIA